LLPPGDPNLCRLGAVKARFGEELLIHLELTGAMLGKGDGQGDWR